MPVHKGLTTVLPASDEAGNFGYVIVTDPKQRQLATTKDPEYAIWIANIGDLKTNLELISNMLKKSGSDKLDMAAAAALATQAQNQIGAVLSFVDNVSLMTNELMKRTRAHFEQMNQRKLQKA